MPLFCPALNYAECPVDPRACIEACQLRPDPED